MDTDIEEDHGRDTKTLLMLWEENEVEYKEKEWIIMEDKGSTDENIGRDAKRQEM